MTATIMATNTTNPDVSQAPQIYLICPKQNSWSCKGLPGSTTPSLSSLPRFRKWNCHLPSVSNLSLIPDSSLSYFQFISTSFWLYFSIYSKLNCLLTNYSCHLGLCYPRRSPGPHRSFPRASLFHLALFQPFPIKQPKWFLKRQIK